MLYYATEQANRDDPNRFGKAEAADISHGSVFILNCSALCYYTGWPKRV